MFIFSIIVLSLATVQFPEGAPGYADGAYWAAALVAGLVFYASLLAHEVGMLTPTDVTRALEVGALDEPVIDMRPQSPFPPRPDTESRPY